MPLDAGQPVVRPALRSSRVIYAAMAQLWWVLCWSNVIETSPEFMNVLRAFVLCVLGQMGRRFIERPIHLSYR